MNTMVYFRDENFLKTFVKNQISATKKFFRSDFKEGEKTLPKIKQTGKTFGKVDLISFGRSFIIRRDCVVAYSENIITFDPFISFGGVKDDKIFFVNKKFEEVAFFSLKDVKEIVLTNKD